MIVMLLAMIVILKMMMKCHCLLTVDFMAVVVGGSSVTMSPRKHLLVTSIHLGYFEEKFRISLIQIWAYFCLSPVNQI